MPVILLFFFLPLLKKAFFWTYIFQIKEYRKDRILTLVKEGKILPLLISKRNMLVLIFVLFILFDNIFISRFFQFAAGIFYTLETIITLIRIRSVKAPKITVRTSMMLVTLFFLLAISYALSGLPVLLITGIFDLLVPILLFVILIVVAIPFETVKELLIFFASWKFRSLNDIKVIAVTGSYGKSSVKEFLSELLLHDFLLGKTKAFQNTNIAIALEILRNLNKKHSLFIAEIGAYKKGEIRKSARYLKLDLVVVTGLGNQHIDLFGGRDNLLSAKSEAALELKNKGSLAVNLSSPYSEVFISMILKKRPDIRVFGYAGKRNIRAARVALGFNMPLLTWDVKSFSKKMSSVKFSLGKEKLNVNLFLPGKASVENAAGALLSAFIITGKFEKFKKNLEHLKSLKKTMEYISPASFVSSVIDDTNNMSSESMFEALHLCSQFKGIKCIVLSPLIEASEHEAVIYREFLQKAKAGRVFIIAANNFLYVRLINIRKSKNVFLWGSVETRKLMEKVKKDREAVLIFEGRESGVILKEFGLEGTLLKK